MNIPLCDYCNQNKLDNFIRCAECIDFKLCLLCFSCGVECGPHRKDHKYRVGRAASTSVFEDGVDTWSLPEEYMLLDALEQYGFGNWSVVAANMGTRSPSACWNHYEDFYMNGNIGKATILPSVDCNIVDYTSSDRGQEHTGKHSSCLESPVSQAPCMQSSGQKPPSFNSPYQQFPCHKLRSCQSPGMTHPLPPLDLSLQEQQMLGYMPLRDEFEKEYDNDAEKAVSGLTLDADLDDDIDIGVKVACVNRLRMRLRERDLRKHISKCHSLVSFSVGSSPKSSSGNREVIHRHATGLNTDDRALMEKVRQMAQFQSSADIERLQTRLHAEREQKLRIKELIVQQKNGLTLLRDKEECENALSQTERRQESGDNLRVSHVPQSCPPLPEKTDVPMEKLKILIDDDDFRDEEDGSVAEDVSMSSMPCYDLLSVREKKLCNSINMVPATYMTIKTHIIRDYCDRRRGIIPVKLRFPSGLDNTHRRRIVSFLSDNGWIGVV